MQHLSMWFLLIVLSPGAYAQTSPPTTLTVLAKGSGIPVSRAEVKVGDTKTYTDKQGAVAITVPAGQGVVEIYRSSYTVLQVPFADLRGKSTYKAYLRPAQPGDNEVLVRGAKRQETSRKNVTIQEAVKVAPGGDPAQVPKLLPGVQSSPFRPDVVVRGSGPNDTAYLVDDFAVPFIFHRIGNLSVMPDQLLSDVEFSSGGFGAQYGGVTGGVINLRTKSEVPERPKTEFTINIPFYSGIYYETPINDGKDLVAISARRSTLEPVLKLALRGQDNDFTLVPYFGDEHFFYVHPEDDGQTKILAMHAYDGLHALFPTDAATDDSGTGKFDVLTSFQMLGVEKKVKLNDAWSMTISPNVNHQENYLNILDNFINILVTTVDLQTEFTHRLGGKDKIFYGIDVAYAKADVNVLAPIVDDNDPFFDFQEAPKQKTVVHQAFHEESLYVAMDKELGKFLLTPGLRASHNTIIDKSYLDPRLNARLQLTPAHALKVAAGQYSQTPQFQDADKSFGNPDLDFIRSYHYVLGLETNWSDLWTTDFEVFYKNTIHLVRSDAEKRKDNDGSSTSAGFEAFIRRNLTERLFGWVSYTFSKTQERDSDQETYYTSQYDQTHIMNFAGNYKLTGQWDVGSRLIFHTGDPITTIDDAVYNSNLDKYQARRDPEAEPNNGRLPSYHELDVFTSVDALYDTWKLNWRFGIEYIALRPQAQGEQYNYDYSDKDYFTFPPFPIPYVAVRGTI